MSLLLVGLNHKSAPVEIREQLAFDEQSCVGHLQELTDGAVIREGLILSTCNRVEILIETESDSAFDKAVEFLSGAKQIEPRFFVEHLYQYSGADAVNHLFRVASSLDSMILGEPQILSQVRQAYTLATKAGTVRRVLHKLLHHTLSVAKRVRTETGIAQNAVSISFAAVESARKIFGSLADKTVLLVGAGEMAELAAKHLASKGTKRILIANRTIEHAASLAMEFSGEVVSLEKLENALPQADIIICSTAAPEFVINAAAVEASQKLRQNRPAFFVDISVPRNIAPEIQEIEGVFLQSIDDLQTVIESNRQQRRIEAARAEAIIAAEVAEFQKSLQILDIGETLGLLRTKMQEMARAEFSKNRAKLGALTIEQELAMEKLLISTVNKISHPVLYGLRHTEEQGAAEFVKILGELLNDFVTNQTRPGEKKH
jgi:glutamyl-tRNA reductase